MNRPVLTALALSLLLMSCGGQNSSPTASAPLHPILGSHQPEAIAGQYIVVFKEGSMVSEELSTQHTDGRLSSLTMESLGLDAQGLNVQQVYATALKGFAAQLSPANLERLQNDPRVAYIEQDAHVSISSTQSGAPWGLDRIDQRSLPLNQTYNYESGGTGTTAYIIDTGIYTAHQDFGGRARWGTNTTGDGNNSDCQGHGTHVAGTVGGKTYGVAKGVELIAVKVLDCEGSGSNSGVIAGINWAVQHKGSASAVANMSLGGGYSRALNDAVNRAVSQNLLLVVAAGNESQNACNVSPASAPSAVTVASSTKSDYRSSFSNYGKCVDLFAPGSNILSSWIGSSTATNTISGTSMATPHVTGAAALALAQGQSVPDAINSLISRSTTGKIKSAGSGTPNKLLYTGP